MHIFYLEYKDGVDVQQLRSNVLAVDATLSQAPSAKDFPVPGRSAVACSELEEENLAERKVSRAESDRVGDERKREVDVGIAVIV